MKFEYNAIDEVQQLLKHGECVQIGILSSFVHTKFEINVLILLILENSIPVCPNFLQILSNLVPAALKSEKNRQLSVHKIHFFRDLCTLSCFGIKLRVCLTHSPHISRGTLAVLESIL